MTQTPLTGIVLDERYELTITEICRACGGTTEWVVELVEEGVLEPARKPAVADSDEWRFPGSCLARARTAMRLQRDLGVNLAGVALALEMMDEIERLRGRLQHIEPG